MLRLPQDTQVFSGFLRFTQEYSGMLRNTQNTQVTWEILINLRVLGNLGDLGGLEYLRHLRCPIVTLVHLSSPMVQTIFADALDLYLSLLKPWYHSSSCLVGPWLHLVSSLAQHCCINGSKVPSLILDHWSWFNHTVQKCGNPWIVIILEYPLESEST